MGVLEVKNSFSFMADGEDEDVSKLVEKQMAKAAAAAPAKEKKPARKEVKREENVLNPETKAKPLVLPDHLLKRQVVLRKGEDGKKAGRVHFGGASGAVALSTVLTKEKGVLRAKDPDKETKKSEELKWLEEYEEAIVDKIIVSGEIEKAVTPEREKEESVDGKTKLIKKKKESVDVKNKLIKKKKEKGNKQLELEREETVSSSEAKIRSMNFMGMVAMFVGLGGMLLSGHLFINVNQRES